MSFCFRSAISQYFRSVRTYASQAQPQWPKKGDKVIVGMSGGVDSSVTAKLLADQDYDLSAVFMRNWDTRDESGTDKGCEWEKDWEDVQRVCNVLDIPCSMVDLSRQYWNNVFEPSLYDWEKGVTPNPDVWCNKEIKFGELLKHLPTTSSNPQPWFATGHYARKAWSTDPIPRPKLLSAVDPTKDQAYYLSSIPEDGLARALFPLGGLKKTEVREIAAKARLPTADRAESMGLCFVGEKARFNKFLANYILPKPGSICHLETGSEVATHDGLWTLTIGQKAKIPGMPEKMFVAKKDPDTNTIYVVPGPDHEALYCKEVEVKNFSWIWADSPPPEVDSEQGLNARAKIRHRMETVPCRVVRASKDRGLKIQFDVPEKGVAPGQVAAIWDIEGDWVLGCGVITDVKGG